jgi:hypothetical protein
MVDEDRVLVHVSQSIAELVVINKEIATSLAKIEEVQLFLYNQIKTKKQTPKMSESVSPDYPGKGSQM